MYSTQAQAQAQTLAEAHDDLLAGEAEVQAKDLSELDNEAYQRFMKQLLADLARQRHIARAWRLPTLVMPGGACAMA